MGTYAEYCLADPWTAVRIPEDVAFEAAASVGLSGFTASQTLFQSLEIESPLNPSAESEPVSICIIQVFVFDETNVDSCMGCGDCTRSLRCPACQPIWLQSRRNCIFLEF